LVVSAGLLPESIGLTTMCNLANDGNPVMKMNRINR